MKFSLVKYLIIFLIPILSSCTRNIKSERYSFKIIVPIHKEKKISREEFEDIFCKLFELCQESSNLIEIIIYNYSSVKETFYYAGNKNDNIKMIVHKGSIDALMKIKKDGNLKKIYFIKAPGNSKKEIIENLAFETRKILQSI